MDTAIVEEDRGVDLTPGEWNFIVDSLKGVSKLVSYLDGSPNGSHCFSSRGEDIDPDELAAKIFEQI